MRSSNPVLNNSETFANPQNYAMPGGQQYGEFAVQRPVVKAMTLDDVIAKSAILFTIVVAAAAATWYYMWNFGTFQSLYAVTIISSLAAFFTSILVMRRHTVPPALAMVFSAFEGVFVGGFSLVVGSYIGDMGIVTEAVFATLVAFAVTLAAYRFLGARVSGRMQRVVLISMFAFVGAMLLNLVLSFFNINLGLAAIGPNATPIAWIAAGIGVVLAVFSLLMDFEMIERGIRAGAPEAESWRAAFALVVTLVWLYTNLLRILSFFRN